MTNLLTSPNDEPWRQVWAFKLLASSLKEQAQQELAAGHTARDGALHRAIQKHGPAYLVLVGLARALAYTAGAEGITVADLREAAAKSTDTLPQLVGVTPEDIKGTGRRLSWLGGALSSAGLTPTGKVRRSHIAGSHGNRHVVWLHPDFALSTTSTRR